MGISNIISYFRSCYREEHSQPVLFDSFSSSQEHVLFIEGEEKLVSGAFPSIPLDGEAGIRLCKAASVYRQEMDLLYCALFIAGKGPGLSGHAAFPVLLHAAEIHEVDSYPFLSILPDEFRVNANAFRELTEDAGKANDFYETLHRSLSEQRVGADRIRDIVFVIKDHFPETEIEPCHSFPRLMTPKEIRSFREKSGLYLLPGACVCLVRKSSENRGILNECDRLIEGGAYSRPIELLLGDAAMEDRTKLAHKIETIPAVLSKNQHDILVSSAAREVTLVIGPPGTGKSFTIAAIAAEHVSRGKTVLIASKKNHAVDIIADKLEEMLGEKDCVVRGGRRQYLKALKAYLDTILHGMAPRPPHSADVRRLEHAIGRLENESKKAEKRFGRRVRIEMKLGQAVSLRASGGYGSLFAPLLAFFRKIRLTSFPPLHALWASIEDNQTERIALSARLIGMRKNRRIADTLKHHRKELMTFLSALKARTGERQNSIFDSCDIGRVLFAFPVWLATTADIHDNLPLERELFDLAVIDEATQCDIAGCIPVLYRSKRVVIVGDPRQLRHLSFVSTMKQSAFARENGLTEKELALYDYRSKSILDLASEKLRTQDAVLFLNEHFRSLPGIIGFSNAKFYGNAITVMTDNPKTARFKCVELKRCDGRRDAAGINRVEAEALMCDVRELIGRQKLLPEGACHSIGIMTPFRDQADYLSKTVMETCSVQELQRHALLVGTPYAFQGCERDVVFISLAVDGSSHPSAFLHLNKPDVFNVMITRARDRQVVYASLSVEHIEKDSLVRNYLDFVAAPPLDESKQRSPVYGDGIDTILEALNRHGIRTWPEYRLAGLPLDMVVEYNEKCCGIDLIGFGGEIGKAFPLERYKILKRAGFRLYPLTCSEWMAGGDECAEAIKNFLSG